MLKQKRTPSLACRLRFRRFLAVERLEDRTLLSHAVGRHVIARFDGAFASPAETKQLDITLAPADFTLQSSHTVVLGFLLRTAEESELDPAAMQVRTAAGVPVAPEVVSPDLAGRAQSFFLADLRLGSYRLTLNAERATLGAFELDVFLAGDATGNRTVDFADRDLIQSLFGSVAGDNRYRPEADANLDGRRRCQCGD